MPLKLFQKCALLPYHVFRMRLFVGIPLPDVTIEELSAVAARLRATEDGLRWTTPESWHITVQFLGNTGGEQYERTLDRLRQVRASAVSIGIEGLGIFDRAGVFFAGVKVSPKLLLLQESVAAATAQCGFIPETRPYQPHITLARSKADRQGLLKLKTKILRQPAFSRFVADEFILYESFLDPGGSRYEVRERFPLGGN
jgi:2'-5' RNA ligase